MIRAVDTCSKRLAVSLNNNNNNNNDNNNNNNNFSRCCGWLRFATQPKLLIFTLGIQTFVLPYNNKNIKG